VRFALLCWPLEEAAIEALCERLKVPNEERELALTACRCKPLLGAKTPEQLLELFKRGDAFRRRERFGLLLQAAKLAQPELELQRVEKALQAAAAVDAGAIARAAPTDIPARLDEARRQAIAKAL
jgi:tRNA nucleotidyltransferase (CCA-adding enzyme)